jgi:hypothetical protein
MIFEKFVTGTSDDITQKAVSNELELIAMICKVATNQQYCQPASHDGGETVFVKTRHRTGRPQFRCRTCRLVARLAISKYNPRHAQAFS